MLFGIPFGTYLAVGSALIAVGRIIEDRFVEQYLADGL